MTYKNIKFSESDVMKEFEKIALDKKILSEVPIKNTKIEITSSLDANIFNLIKVLGEKDNSLAEEIKNDFLNYKKAQVQQSNEDAKAKAYFKQRGFKYDKPNNAYIGIEQVKDSSGELKNYIINYRPLQDGTYSLSNRFVISEQQQDKTNNEYVVNDAKARNYFTQNSFIFSKSDQKFYGLEDIGDRVWVVSYFPFQNGKFDLKNRKPVAMYNDGMEVDGKPLVQSDKSAKTVYKKSELDTIKFRKLAAEISSDMKKFYDSAHPEGSVKTDKDSDSVVEDLYDNHDAIMKIVNKVNLKKKASLIKKSYSSEYYENKVNAILNQMQSLIASEVSKIQAAKDSNVYSDSEKSSNFNQALTNRAVTFLGHTKNITNTFGGLGSGFTASNTLDSITHESISEKIYKIINKVNDLYKYTDTQVNQKFPEISKNIGNIIESTKNNLTNIYKESQNSKNNTNIDLGEFDTNKPGILTDLGEVNITSKPKMYNTLTSWKNTLNSIKSAANQARLRLDKINEEGNNDDAEWVTNSENYLNSVLVDIGKIESSFNAIENEAYDNEDDAYSSLSNFGFVGEALDDFNDLLGFRNSVNAAKANLGEIK